MIYTMKGDGKEVGRLGSDEPTGLSSASPIEPATPSRRCAHQSHGAWCEPCFRAEQRKRWGYSLWDYCDLLGRAHG